MTFTGSGALSILALVLFATVNMNYGIDFKGGSLIEVKTKTDQAANIGDIRSKLSALNLGDVQVQEFGNPSDVLIRVESQGGGENAEQTVITKVRSALEDQYDFRRVEVVGPTVSGELARAGTIGVLAALLAILIYIWLRFEWQFAVGAIMATVHDVVMTIGFFVVTGVEFNLSSIAAILTIVGSCRTARLVHEPDIAAHDDHLVDNVTGIVCAVPVWRRSHPLIYCGHAFRCRDRNLFVNLHCRAAPHPFQSSAVLTFGQGRKRRGKW
jgi:hypothetical protein